MFVVQLSWKKLMNDYVNSWRKLGHTYQTIGNTFRTNAKVTFREREKSEKANAVIVCNTEMIDFYCDLVI